MSLKGICRSGFVTPPPPPLPTIQFRVTLTVIVSPAPVTVIVPVVVPAVVQLSGSTVTLVEFLGVKMPEAGAKPSHVIFSVASHDKEVPPTFRTNNA